MSFARGVTDSARAFVLCAAGPGGARGQETGALRKPAGASFAGALTLADCISAEPIVLFACAAGGQEASAAGLLGTP